MCMWCQSEKWQKMATHHQQLLIAVIRLSYTKPDFILISKLFAPEQAFTLYGRKYVLIYIYIYLLCSQLHSSILLTRWYRWQAMRAGAECSVWDLASGVCSQFSVTVPLENLPEHVHQLAPSRSADHAMEPSQPRPALPHAQVPLRSRLSGTDYRWVKTFYTVGTLRYGWCTHCRRVNLNDTFEKDLSYSIEMF